MPSTQYHASRSKPAIAGGKVMIAVMAGQHAPAIATTEDWARWRRLTPAIWTTVNLRHVSPAEILPAVSVALHRWAARPDQLILLGEGDLGRRALELVLQGHIDCAAILAVDIPSHPLSFRITPAAAAIRLVAHQDGSETAGDDLLGNLQAADIDARIIRLQPRGANDVRATASAIETFLLELVATVSRLVKQVRQRSSIG
jgi:hypothetical protein